MTSILESFPTNIRVQRIILLSEGQLLTINDPLAGSKISETKWFMPLDTSFICECMKYANHFSFRRCPKSYPTRSFFNNEADRKLGTVLVSNLDGMTRSCCYLTATVPYDPPLCSRSGAERLGSASRVPDRGAGQLLYYLYPYFQENHGNYLEVSLQVRHH